MSSRVMLMCLFLLVGTAAAQNVHHEDPFFIVAKTGYGLRNPTPHVREESAKNLAKYAQAVRAEIVILARLVKSDPDLDVRTEAAVALGKIGPSAYDAIPALVVALKDKHQM